MLHSTLGYPTVQFEVSSSHASQTYRNLVQTHAPIDNMVVHRHVRYTKDDASTERTILAFVFLITSIFTTMLLASHIFRTLKQRREQHTNGQDLEAYQPLLLQNNPFQYFTLPSFPGEDDQQDLNTREILRHERVCENISAVYQISARSSEDDDVSLSSDSQTEEGDIRGAAEEEEESSESEIDSSDGSDTDREEVSEVRGLMNIERPCLPRRVAVLRRTMG